MVDAVIHIGLGKSGSSALQYALSQRPIIKALKNKKYKQVRYVSIDKTGYLYEGKQLANYAKYVPSGYSRSCNPKFMKTFSDEMFSLLNSKLHELSNNGESLIVLSSEGWSIQANQFKNNDIFKKLGINAYVICYVRNPVEWINSAWWQWGAWSGMSLDDYVMWAIKEEVSKWPNILKKWQNYLGKEQVTVKVLPKDIIRDFYEFIGVSTDSISTFRSNSTLSAEFLRFYQQHRELRPSPHESAMDFILSDVMPIDNSFEKTPWVLNEKHIKSILEETYDSNQSLIKLFENNSKEVCINDNKWWELSAFINKRVSTEFCYEDYLPIEKLDAMLFLSLKSIKKLYLENLKLKKMLDPK
ncbi:MAG: hypothetical protein U9O64_06885 [Campylobacterota bacterium]|nr:hypothetical protein [Campylobacterota bacterium]